MNDLYKNYPRLALLLDQLCEQQLDQAGADELSELIQSDPQAADWYVRYLELHAHLSWDLAIPGEGESGCLLPLSTAETNSIQQITRELIQELELETSGMLLEGSEPVSVSKWSSWKKTVPALTVTAAMLFLSFLFLRGGDESHVAEQQVAGLNNSSSTAETSSDNATTDSAAGAEKKQETALPPEIPQLNWSGMAGTSRQAKDLNSGSKAEVSTPLVQETPRSVAPLSDAEIVSAINQQIQAGWEDFAVTPSPEAGPYELVRRVYLDLAGRIPTAGEVQEFVDSRDAKRYEKLVDRLLESPDFALQWSSRWTNLLVGRSPNEQVDRMSLQAYLRESAEEERGWDLVVQDLISAEGDPREVGAANFLVAHLNNQAVPATAFVAKTLLGSQIHCAQCHKHPYYDASQQDFWELNSFFKQAVVKQVPGSSAEMSSGRSSKMPAYQLIDENIGGATYYETLGGVMQVAYPRFNGVSIDAEKTVSRRQELAKILTSGNDSQIAYAFVNRTWSHYFGHGFTSPVDDLGPHNPPTHPALFKLLAKAFTERGYDVKQLARWICLSRPYQLSSQVMAGNREDAPALGGLPAFSRMYFKPLTAEQLYDSLLAIKGDYSALRENSREQLLDRDHWTGQFVSSLQNDENDESNHFEGTISQALAMMNGELVVETISPVENPAMGQLVKAAVPDLEKFEQLCLAVLSRKPRAEELTLFRKLTVSLRNVRNPAEREVLLAHRLEDVLWAYLNSSEFIVNH